MERQNNTMQQKYSGLHELLRHDREAQDYYNTLPEYVQDCMRDRADGINSFESLRHYADNLTRGEI